MKKLYSVEIDLGNDYIEAEFVLNGGHFATINSTHWSYVYYDKNAYALIDHDHDNQAYWIDMDGLDVYMTLNSEKSW